MPGETAGDTPKTQVWLLPLSGGEPRRVSNLQNGVTGFQWSPDGTRIVVESQSGPSDAAKSPSDVRHYFHAHYKFNDTGWFDDKRSHLWVVDVATGGSTQLTSGDNWNDSDPQWSPDGRRVAFVSDRSGHEFDESYDSDIWVIGADGSGLTKISDHNTEDASPRWSPDGQTIAFVNTIRDTANKNIWLVSSAGGGHSRLAAEGLDLIPANLRWADAGRALYFETGMKGTSQIYRVDVATRRFASITSGDRTFHLFTINDRTNRLAYAINDPTHLDDLFVADLNGRGERPLTHLNAALMKQLTLSPVERVPFKGADGWDVDGFFMKPVGWEPGKKYPMVLTIHGGPAGQLGFDWYHEFQVYRAHGWAVFFTNPRGSTGYGENLSGDRAQLGRQGLRRRDERRRYDLAKYSWIDRDRLGVTGGSYGGYLTNWIVSHTTRFKAAVTLRSVSNFISDDGTRDGARAQRGFRGRHL
jgi:dipeptidyl aminopeptidase/acylaminoacyl peptidase